jgi:hypothetical protein
LQHLFHPKLLYNFTARNGWRYCNKINTLALQSKTMALPTSPLFQQARFFLTLAIIVVTSSKGFSQQNAAIKLQTFRVLDGLYTLSFEQAVGKHFSGQFSLEYGSYIKMRPNRSEDYKAKGLGAIGALRYYPFTQKLSAPQGFFTYAAFRHIHFHDTYIGSTNGVSRYDGRGNVLSIGGGLGYKFVYHRLGLEGFVGWGAGRMTRDDEGSSMPEYFRTGMNEQKHFPQLDVALCYMFTSSSGK